MDAVVRVLPERRPAWQALRRLGTAIQRNSGGLPLVLHGPTGTGKTYLVNQFVEGLIAEHGKTVITEVAAELGRELLSPPMERRAQVRELFHADLLIIEDLQHLQPMASNELAYILDHRRVRGKANLITANSGPGEWALSPRLCSRLVSGLVIGLPPLGVSSRRIIAAAMCADRQLKVAPEVVDWLTRHTGGLRPMLGDITRLETLAKADRGLLTLPVVQAALIEPNVTEPSLLDRICEQVESRFRVSHQMLLGPSRLKNIVYARQLAMYLAREAGMSLSSIGTYFGGRDHTTVHHAVEKMTAEFANNPQNQEWMKLASA